jgi:ubiquinone/menaquinone biosynthesis C-methylase UbiE
VSSSQAEIDGLNAAFWSELCGSALARQLGITEPSVEALARFDAAYMGMYPYLDRYLPDANSRGQRLLEIGLGYGTVSQLLASRGFDYQGLDIAAGPVDMVRYRLAHLRLDDPESRVRVGSALEIPHEDESFDHLVTIGCLHHTGDLPRAVAEVERVLRPGGRALVMLYNRRSFRRMRMAAGRWIRGQRLHAEEIRGSYDRNLEGEAAPTTDYTSVGEARRLFAAFSEVRIRRENFDDLSLGPLAIPRGRLLGWPARVAGLDLYITAIR